MILREYVYESKRVIGDDERSLLCCVDIKVININSISITFLGGDRYIGAVSL